MNSKTQTERPAFRRAYDKKWYEANRLYKRTYQRFYRRATNHKCSIEQRVSANTAIDEIIRDRREQIKSRKWINEHTGRVYKGVKVSR